MSSSEKNVAQKIVEEKNGKTKDENGVQNKKSRSRAHTGLQRKTERLEKEIEELKDKFLRKVAEFDNYKKRTDAEMLQVGIMATAELMKELLPVFDDLERSLEAAKKSKDFNALFTGVELIYKNLSKVFESRGVKVMESVGKPFDPEKHDALMQVENKDFPPGVVVDEHLKGYLMGDRVLRHSQVLVNKSE